MRRSFLLVGVFAVGCARPPPTRPPPPAIHVPPGCEANLTGTYVHATDPTYLYQGLDDGGTFTLEVGRAFANAPDGGAKDVRIALTRTPAGFLGSTRATAFNAVSQPCAISLPTSVAACSDGGVTLRTVGAVELDARCQVKVLGSPVDEPLLRFDAGTR